MLSYFQKARENARKADEYDAIAATIGEDFWKEGKLSNRVSFLHGAHQYWVGFGRRMMDRYGALEKQLSAAKLELSAIKAQRLSNLKQFQPKAAAEKKVDA